MVGYRQFLVSYLIAVLATVAAVFVRWQLNPLLDDRLPFITLYAAVAIAVWKGGWRPALLASILAAKQRIIEAGFDHHLVKPVDSGALAELLAGAALKHREVATSTGT